MIAFHSLQRFASETRGETVMKFTKRAVDAIESTNKRQVFFDDDFTGFALRVSETGKKSFYFSYRTGKGRAAEKKWVMLGAFPTMSVEQARQKAKDMAASVQQGIDPAKEIQADKEAKSMKEALQSFLDEHVSKLKPGTIKSYTMIIKKYLIPNFGKLRVKEVIYSDIAKFHHTMQETPYLANRSYAVLSKFFSWCELHGHRERGDSPCRGITKYKELKRQDFIGATELAILGDTLARMEENWIERKTTKEKRTSEFVDTITTQAAAAIRLLMFTGARVGEILSLEWSNIDLEQGTARLPDSKTGFKVLQLPAPALAVLEALPRLGKWVFPADSESGHMVNIKDAWGDVLKQANLSGWRLHDLRHCFASMMVNSGASLPIVGKILGHNNVSTTQRYAHLEQNPARKAAEDAASKIAKALQRKMEINKKIISLQVANAS
jgi:integrase